MSRWAGDNDSIRLLALEEAVARVLARLEEAEQGARAQGRPVHLAYAEGLLYARVTLEIALDTHHRMAPLPWETLPAPPASQGKVA